MSFARYCTPYYAEFCRRASEVLDGCLRLVALVTYRLLRQMRIHTLLTELSVIVHFFFR
jgi:hypothetical protein